MTLRRLFHVLVIGAGALVSGACATGSGASQSGEVQRLPDGGVATPPPAPAPTMQQSGGPSGW